LILTVSLAILAVGIIVNFVTWRGIKWKLRLQMNVDDYKDLEAASAAYRQRASSNHTVYELIAPLTIKIHSEAETNLVRRVLQYRSLPKDFQELAVERSDAWLAAARLVGESGARRRGANLRPFLQTFHLSVIREGSIAEVVLISQLLDQIQDSEAEGELLKGNARAIALTELARKYNNVAKQQRSDVTFTQTTATGERLIVCPAPTTSTFQLDLCDRFNSIYRITKNDIESASTRLRDSVSACRTTIAGTP
jgi:hypothetical protein